MEKPNRTFHLILLINRLSLRLGKATAMPEPNTNSLPPQLSFVFKEKTADKPKSALEQKASKRGF
jgi:hypothetical protein